VRERNQGEEIEKMWAAVRRSEETPRDTKRNSGRMTRGKGIPDKNVGKQEKTIRALKEDYPHDEVHPVPVELQKKLGETADAIHQ